MEPDFCYIPSDLLGDNNNRVMHIAYENISPLPVT